MPQNENSLRWTVSNRIPDSPTIKIVFHGLLAFCHNGDLRCEIGAHNRAEDHSPTLEIIENGKQTDFLDAAEFRRLGAQIIELTAEAPDPPGVSFFMQGGMLDRCKPKDNPNDFRWMLDMEGRDFYDRPPGQPLDKKLGFFSPKLIVHHGVFYTLDTTKNKFKRSLRGDRMLGHLSFFMAANIKLKSGRAFLRGGGLNREFEAAKKYQINFKNVCLHKNKECKFKPGSLNKEERNDFFEYYKTFAIPPGREEFELTLHGTPINARHSFKKLGLMADVGPTSTDPAPCGGLGFGQTTGLP